MYLFLGDNIKNLMKIGASLTFARHNRALSSLNIQIAIHKERGLIVIGVEGEVTYFGRKVWVV